MGAIAAVMLALLLLLGVFLAVWLVVRPRGRTRETLFRPRTEGDRT